MVILQYSTQISPKACFKFFKTKVQKLATYSIALISISYADLLFSQFLKF